MRAEGGGAGGAEAARIRAELLRVVQPSWQEVTRDFKVRQLHFHMGPGSTSYLRVHKPKLFGDDMNQCRYTVVTANQALKTVTGFETGRVVSGIRGVVPVFAIGPDGGEASHVGALEAGTSFGTILPRLSRRLHAGLAVLLTDRHVQANVWPNQMHRAFADTTTYEDFFVEAYTGPAHHSVFEAGLLRDLFAEPGTRLVELDGFAHAVTGFHLRDWRAENNAALPPVGLVLIWTDATDQVAAFQRAVWINVFYALLGFCVVEILLFIAVKLITRHLEIVIADRTAQLNSAQDLLVENAHKVGMAEVATDVLHNVGNVLNSVSVGASTLRDRVRNSRLEGLQKAADLLRDQAAGSDAVQDDERDHKLPTYLASLAEHLQQEQTESLAAITNLQDHIEHLSRIVSSQQDHCRGGGLLEPVDLKPFVDRALEINGALLETRRGPRRQEAGGSAAGGPRPAPHVADPREPDPQRGRGADGHRRRNGADHRGRGRPAAHHRQGRRHRYLSGEPDANLRARLHDQGRRTRFRPPRRGQHGLRAGRLAPGAEPGARSGRRIHSYPSISTPRSLSCCLSKRADES